VGGPQRPAVGMASNMRLYAFRSVIISDNAHRLWDGSSSSHYSYRLRFCARPELFHMLIRSCFSAAPSAGGCAPDCVANTTKLYRPSILHSRIDRWLAVRRDYGCVDEATSCGRSNCHNLHNQTCALSSATFNRVSDCSTTRKRFGARTNFYKNDSIRRFAVDCART
jgi:hypothetical protein